MAVTSTRIIPATVIRQGLQPPLRYSCATPGHRRLGFRGLILFSFEHVTKRFGAVTALEDLSLEFQAGTVNAVIGSSGSGKSTLLRLLLGLEWPDSGRIRIAGQELSRSARLGIRQHIGYVIQEGGLFPHLRVRDNLALLPRHLSWPAGRIVARSHELLQLMQLPASVLERYPGELSSGQRQRVAVMRALITEPPALLLDEPLGALDPLVRFDLQQRLRELFASLAKTVILVTHDLAEAAYLAPRLVLMQAGRVVQDGTAAEFIEHPRSEFVRRFVAAHRSLPLGQAAGG
jgi:osmoprotectant transport system ATP-binding protein